MQTIERFPHEVRDIEHVTVPVRDGTRLAARIWLPADAERGPVPAILEYVPYRKRDGTRLRDEPMHRWFAGHGYAAIRVDLRGSGESEGVLEDEYAPQEQEDAVDVIRWIAAQPWCDGAVGMMGKSWGGFSALQVAALRPPELKAVIAVCATDDRYSDDAHYMGGCVLGENLVWGSTLMALCAQPPDPALVGAGWRELWLSRLSEVRPFPAIWLRHQERDEYWRHGSICEDFAAVACPVLAISGWADGYTNAVPRLLAGLRSPRLGIIGPWAHVYPHDAVPGPAIGFLQEARRWWDRWLRGIDNDVMREPRLRVWMQHSERPRETYSDRSGQWVAEPEWPSDRVEWRTLGLAHGELTDTGRGSGRATVRSPQSLGAAAGAWCGFGLEGELPGDQRVDDERSLVFDTPPLDVPLAILGAPELELRLSADRPVANLCARLCEVFPDGASARLSYGLLNLTHRHGHDRAEPLLPGRHESVRLVLNDLGHVVAAGNRLRLALSSTYWPVVWPAPSPVSLELDLGTCSLRLPVRPPRAADADPPRFAPAVAAPRPSFTDVHEGGVRRTFERDAEGVVTAETVLDLEADGSPSLTRFDDIGLESGHGIREVFRIADGDPLSAFARVEHRTRCGRGDWDAAVALDVTLRSDETAFRFEAELVAREGARVVFERRWDEVVPRSSTAP